MESTQDLLVEVLLTFESFFDLSQKVQKYLTEGLTEFPQFTNKEVQAQRNSLTSQSSLTEKVVLA